MVGIGERDEEVLEILDDIQAASKADVLTIGQYLQPTRNHLPIDRWVHPDTFVMFKAEALSRVFESAKVDPLSEVRITQTNKPSNCAMPRLILNNAWMICAIFDHCDKSTGFYLW